MAASAEKIQRPPQGTRRQGPRARLPNGMQLSFFLRHLPGTKPAGEDRQGEHYRARTYRGPASLEEHDKRGPASVCLRTKCRKRILFIARVAVKNSGNRKALLLGRLVLHLTYPVHLAEQSKPHQSKRDGKREPECKRLPCRKHESHCPSCKGFSVSDILSGIFSPRQTIRASFSRSPRASTPPPSADQASSRESPPLCSFRWPPAPPSQTCA